MKKIIFLILILAQISTVKAAGVFQNNQWGYLPHSSCTFLLSYATFCGQVEDTTKTEQNKRKIQLEKDEKDKTGAIVRINPDRKNIYLVFPADSLFEGGEQILDILNAHQIKGSFFFTGNFLRNQNHKRIIKKIIKDGHYVGPHSDKNILYCDRENQDSTLVSLEKFKTDLENNYKELNKFGIKQKEATYFMPPYEWYNREIVEWSRNLGIYVINFTLGTGTNADNTTPNMKNYKSSEEIWEKLKLFEQYEQEHLNGAILLIHPGTKTARTDKFYNLLDEIIEYMYTNGYRFKSLKN